jgi:hypothetical protein
MSVLAAALSYVEFGWFVFPAPPGEKKSFKSAEHSNGARWGMTRDTQELKRDWAHWPDANVGIVTGPESGIFVVECDTPTGHNVDGWRSMAALEAANGTLPPTRMAESPSGSLHYYFRYPVGITVRNSASQLGSGIDVRGVGGMVIAPPSQRADGQYKWLNELPPADAPPWLLELVREPEREEYVGSDLPAPDDEMIAAALAVVGNPDLDWEQWNRVAMALFAATEGSAAGLAMFHDWSRKSKKYEARATDKKWQALKGCPPTRISVGTLFYLAKEADPEWRERFEGQRSVHGADVEMPAATVQLLEEPAKEQAGAQPAKKSRLHWHGEALPLPVAWLVKGLLQKVGVALLSGQWGLYKSFIAIHLAGCVMTGKNFIDYPVRRSGGVLFIAKEGMEGLPLRLAVMAEHTLNHPSGELLPFTWDDPPLDLLKYGVKHGTPSLIALAQEANAEMQQRFGCPLVMIVIDTVAAAAGFKDNDDAAEGQKVMSALRELANVTETLVLGVEHFGKDIERGTMGTSRKEQHADTVLALIGERALTGKVENPRLGARKVREGESGREIPFRMELIDCGVDPDGDPSRSMVVHWEPDRPIPQRERAKSKAMTTFEYVLASLTDAEGDRQLFPGLVAVPLAKVKEAFITRYMARADCQRGAARERWRNTVEQARVNQEVEQRVEGGETYLCCAGVPF